MLCPLLCYARCLSLLLDWWLLSHLVCRLAEAVAASLAVFLAPFHIYRHEDKTKK
jgi:hypothetical protein